MAFDLDVSTCKLSFDEFDELNYPRNKQSDFDKIAQNAISRREFIGKVSALGSAAFLNSIAISPTNATTSKSFSKSLSKSSFESSFKFSPIYSNTKDNITLPKGFSYDVLVSWGDPLYSNINDFDASTRGDAKTQSHSFGDNNDGMEFYSNGGRYYIAVNNEYTNVNIICGNRPDKKPINKDDIMKLMYAHGISIFEVHQKDGIWGIVKDSKLNRRITPKTKMDITGPARGHHLLKTSYEKTGKVAFGTFNNCGNGKTPWGTYLTCEENFNSYFANSNKNYFPNEKMKRYGIGSVHSKYNFDKIDKRFDISKEPNEPNRFGYIVEIDPNNPNSIPKKHTALGRFKHENAEVVIAKSGQVVVYLGDDERGEFLYRFVSKDKYNPARDNSHLLTDGTLYAAKFYDDGNGEWLELNPKNTQMSKEEICIHTRIAGSKVGATTMDRPEWVAVNPKKAEAYCALTNNKNRGIKPNAGGDTTPPKGPNPRDKNNYGQIVQWKPKRTNHAHKYFTWKLFVLAGNPSVHNDTYGGSSNVNIDNMFNSPDGLRFDIKGGLWIQTDGNYSNKGDFEGMGNNQMLYANTKTKEIKRFLVGPKEAEITGLTWSSDLKTMFVGIQHPGEKGGSTFPNGNVPRSSIIAIKKDDGGLMA